MKNSNSKYLLTTNGLFQQITGSYYLIPNIKKCLKRIIETINSELSLAASIIYYQLPNGKKIILKDYAKTDRNSSNERISELSEILFNENYPMINNTKRILFDRNLEACIIPLRWESMLLGLMILFDENGSLSEDNLIEDLIGAHVTAACIGSRLITSKANALNIDFEYKINQEISVKTLLEWRMQEIFNNFLNKSLPEQNLYREIFRETEKTLIRTALKGTNNNQSKAAKFLGINRNTLRKKIREFKIN